MYERHYQPLLPPRKFYGRLAWNAVLGFIVIALALFMGMAGYHFFEKLPWLDAFANASMILSGMGPVDPMKTTMGKLFAGSYALFSGLLFISVVGFVFAPLVHRFLHKFHMPDDADRSEKENDAVKQSPQDEQ